MLFLVFQLGSDRYALDARSVVEVVPFLSLRRLPRAPQGVTGVFNYRGRPVPAVDLSELTLGQPAVERLSTRIVLVNYSDPQGRTCMLGLICEHATQLLRKDLEAFLETGVEIPAAPYLGPVLMDAGGPIQLLHHRHLLAEPVRELLFSGTPFAET